MAGIFLAAFLIFAASVAWVGSKILRRSRLAKEDLRAAFPHLLQSGFHLAPGPASWFAPVMGKQCANGIRVSLHFRIPGRGYTGRLPYDGVHIWMIQLTGALSHRREELADIFTSFGWKITYQSESRLQASPPEQQSGQTHPDLEAFLKAIESLSR